MSLRNVRITEIGHSTLDIPILGIPTPTLAETYEK
jgi:hypothetical protein